MSVHVEIRGAEKLSFRERQVVALRESGYSNQQVAKHLGVSVGTVTTLFNRAKRKGYQVVIVLDGDPLALHRPDDDELPEERENEEVNGDGDAEMM